MSQEKERQIKNKHRNLETISRVEPNCHAHISKSQGQHSMVFNIIHIHFYVLEIRLICVQKFHFFLGMKIGYLWLISISLPFREFGYPHIENFYM